MPARGTSPHRRSGTPSGCSRRSAPGRTAVKHLRAVVDRSQDAGCDRPRLASGHRLAGNRRVPAGTAPRPARGEPSGASGDRSPGLGSGESGRRDGPERAGACGSRSRTTMPGTSADGDRDGYEEMVFARHHRLTRAAVMAATTLAPDWIDEVADGVTLLCEQSSWCWPAHDDTRARHGAVVPTVTDPFLDLGAGEVAAQLAWIDRLLAEPLDRQVPGIRARVAYEVDRRVLTPFAARRDWHWLGLDGDVHNWSAWIHGNVLVAALRLKPDPARRAHLVDLVIEGLDRYVASLPPDGAIDEGYSYWWNGACRALEALDLLRHATRGAIGDIPSGCASATFGISRTTSRPRPHTSATRRPGEGRARTRRDNRPRRCGHCGPYVTAAGCRGHHHRPRTERSHASRRLGGSISPRRSVPPR